MSTFNLTIDNKVCEAQSGETILAVAKRNGIEIPTLCYHPLVKVYGACGVCLVEAEGSPKLMRACATEVREGLNINTKSERAEQGRKLALELLLSDHRGDCRPPCAQACPAGTDCQGYVGLIANGEYKEAVKLIKEVFPLPASIGRVCPHPCETACRRKLVEEPIAIAQLKQFVGDFDLLGEEPFEDVKAAASGKRVAIIGGGPAGLTAAYFLAKQGHSPVIFEAMPKAGGMLRYGIPQYRLPKDIVDKEIALIEKMGVEIRYNTKIGRDIQFEELEKEYDAVYVAIGAWKSASIRCPGEELEGVLGGIDFLIDVAQNKATGMGQRVAVVGGGNTAMDACRTAVRLGAKEVYILYRRTRAEMPAEDIEIVEAMEEGVDFKFLVAPTKILADDKGRVCGIELQKMELGEPDASGRRRPVPVEGALETLALDTVIAAAGQKVAPEGIPVKLTDWKTIEADEYTFLTDREGVFAGGDGINQGPGIAIAAIGHARKAADVIDSYLKGDLIPYSKPFIISRDDMSEEDFLDKPKQARAEMPHMTPEARRHNFKEVNFGFSEEQAKAEASRCLECGCADYFECKLIRYGREYDVDPQRLTDEKRCREEKDEHPFIERNADKCVLCGLCVRVCEEVVGTVALGLVDRGFDTVVKPEFGTPLKDTDCIACGQCVNLCPTGALTEKQAAGKRVPLTETLTESVCGYCSLGCKAVVASRGETVCRVLPAENQLLCSAGRFGYGVQQQNRLTTPLRRGETVSLPAAVAEFRAKMADVVARYGENSVGVAISDKLTSEEICIAKKLAQKELKTNVVGCFNKKPSAALAVLGRDGSTADYADLESADFILYVGGDLMAIHPVLGMNLRRSAAKLYAVTNEDTLLADRIDCLLKPKVLPGFVAAVTELAAGCALPGHAEFAAAFPNRGCDFTGNIAKEYMAAQKPVIVYDEQTVTYDTALMLCDLALLSGKNKVLALKPRCNSQGLAMAAVGDRTVLETALPGLHALFIIGEDVPELATDHLEYLAVMDTHATDTVAKADLALPLASYLETTGAYVDAGGRVQQVKAAVSPKSGHSNCAILALLGQFDERCAKPDADMKGECPMFKDWAQNDAKLVLPDPEAPILSGPASTDAGLRAFLQTL